MTAKRKSLAKGFVNFLKRPVIWRTIKELGFFGTQSIAAARRCEDMLARDDEYLKKIAKASMECFEIAYTFEGDTQEEMHQAHLKIHRILRGMAGSFYTMGILVGYMAAAAEAEQNEQERQKAAAEVAPPAEEAAT